MRSTVVGLLVVVLAHPVAAQNPSKLDDPIGGEFWIDNPRFLQPCAGRIPVDHIARKANVLVGFENTPDCWLSPRSLRAGESGDRLTGMTVRQALDHLMALMPEYRWKELDGVVVVRPNAAWDDSRNPLNRPTAPFSATNVDLDNVLHMLLRAARPPVFYPHVDVPQPVRPIDRPVDVPFPGGTMLDALNAVIRARGSAEWQVGYAPGHATIAVSTLQFGGGTVMELFGLPQGSR